MNQAPRRAFTVLTLVVALSACATGQGGAAKQDPAKPILDDIARTEAKVKEEAERVAKKKAALKVEFEALHRDETKAALKAQLGAIAVKHAPGIKPAAGPDGVIPPPSSAIRKAVQDDCRQALAATVGRNLSTIMEAELAGNLIEVGRGKGVPDYGVAIADTIGLLFDGTDFEANYKRLVPIVEKKLIELNDELAGHKQRLADLQAEAKGRASGAPPGMVYVPAGKHRIGMDTQEVEAVRKLLGFSGHAGEINKHALGWPAHEVELDDFYIDVNEVTNRDWAEFIKDTNRKPPKHWAAALKEESERATVAGAAEPQPAGPGALMPEWMLDLPVGNITVDDMWAYCDWVGKRPPSEFEWEAAARYRMPGNQAKYWFAWGDTYDLSEPFCNNQTAATHPLRQNRSSPLLPVGSFPKGRSALGINDMAGNAMEMTTSTFTAYPGWSEAKVPSSNDGDPFSGSLYVLRGGTALAPEMYSLTTTRMPMTKTYAEFVGFRTVLSRARGKDLLDMTATRLASRLEAVGPALKDEKGGRPELALKDPTRFTALRAGGWDPDRKVPTRARHIAVATRNTSEFTESARLKAIARETRKPVMMGYFRTDVDLKTSGMDKVPKGAYWITWDPHRVQVTGRTKTALPEGIYLVSIANPETFAYVPNVTPVLVPRSSEPVKLNVDPAGSTLTAILSFPIRDRKEARFIVEMRLTAAEDGSLSEYR